ncbi:MAG: HAD family hydrolase [Chloroflexota bacterium]|nr:HAD family hydrolase [Chloroflexota bacterium]
MTNRPPGPGRAAPVAAVVFDLFNTLTVPIDRSAYHASLVEMARAVGAVPETFIQGWTDDWRERFGGAYSTTQACVRGACEAIGTPADELAIDEAAQIRVDFARRTLEPRADAVATLAKVRSLRLRTALISDCSPDVPLLWPTTPFAPEIEEPLFSCDEGLIKPEPALYLKACERLGVDPDACVYVGDGGNGELSGAARVGMRAILIRTPASSDAYDSERATWPGEAIDALSQLPDLITRAGVAAAD